MYEKFLPFLHTYKFTFNKTKQSPRKGIPHATYFYELAVTCNYKKTPYLCIIGS